MRDPLNSTQTVLNRNLCHRRNLWIVKRKAPVAPLTESEMKEYVGSYSHAPTIWEVFVKGSKLYVKFDGNEHALTKSGDRKFTFGAQNQNELVFVPGKNGKIGFLFTELYGAKKVEK